MDKQETLAELAEEIRRDGVATSGFLIPDGKGAIRAMLPGLPERILAAGRRERDELMCRVKYLEAVNERLTKEAMGRLAEHCLSCARSINGDAAALRQALELCMRYMCEYCRKEAAFSMPGKQCVDGCETLRVAKAALAAPARNCDLIANELNIDPERVPEALNKCENAPIRELIRWIFAKAEKGGVA